MGWFPYGYLGLNRREGGWGGDWIGQFVVICLTKHVRGIYFHAILLIPVLGSVHRGFLDRQHLRRVRDVEEYFCSLLPRACDLPRPRGGVHAELPRFGIWVSRGVDIDD